MIFGSLGAVVAVSQVTTTVLFIIKSRKLKEITYLTKMMMVIANVSCLFFIMWSILYLTDSETFFNFLLFTSPAVRITDIVNFGLMFRFIRLQVQLKASEENSKKILASINRSKKLEWLIYFDLIIHIIALLVEYIYLDSEDVNEKTIAELA